MADRPLMKFLPVATDLPASADEEAEPENAVVPTPEVTAPIEEEALTFRPVVHEPHVSVSPDPSTEESQLRSWGLSLDRVASLVVGVFAPSLNFLRSLIPIAFAATAAFASYWWLQRMEGGEGAVSREKRQLPDYWMEQMHRVNFDLTGELASTLTASYMEHFPHDDSFELEAPRLAIYNGAAAPWHVVAERAWTNGDGKVVELIGAVEIFRLDESGQREYEVLTSDVKYLPEERYAETENAATINGPGLVTNSIGLKANFSRERLQLLSRVKTHYEP